MAFLFNDRFGVNGRSLLKGFCALSGFLAIVLPVSQDEYALADVDNTGVFSVDHTPVTPSELLVGEPKDGEPTPDNDDLLAERFSPLEREIQRLEKREKEASEARTLEEARRKAADENLPKLSDDRQKRLEALFKILKSAKNRKLAENAETEIQRTWETSGSDTIDLLLGWANQALSEKKYGKALDYLDNIIRLEPGFAEGWNRRATIYFLQRDFGRSIADVERTLELEPRHFGALAGLGAMLSELGQEEGALYVYRKALEVNPRMKQVEKAIETLEKMVKWREI